MIKKRVTYKDPFPPHTEMVEDFYFHLSAAELLEMRMEPGVVGEIITRIAERLQRAEDEGVEVSDLENEFVDSDVPKLFQLIKAFVINGYGEVVGGKHRKSSERREEFVASEAYSALILELCSDADAGALFINGMVPKDLPEQAAKLSGKAPASGPRPLMEVKTKRQVTRKELFEMSPEEYKKIQNEMALGAVEFVDDKIPPASTPPDAS